MLVLSTRQIDLPRQSNLSAKWSVIDLHVNDLQRFSVAARWLRRASYAAQGHQSRLNAQIDGFSVDPDQVDT